MLPLLLLIAPSFAQDCDSRALSKKITEASPVGVASVFEDLAACDSKKALRSAPEAFGRMIWTDRSVGALVAAIGLGQTDLVRDWIGQLRSDERSSAVAALGAACASKESVADFLVESHTVLGEKFWSQRWYRALSECRFESVQTLLTEAVDEVAGDRGRFLGVLEVFARNRGVGAVEKITALLQANEDEELAVYLVKTFADAAQVGSAEGQDAEATQAGVAAILQLAPGFSIRTLKQAQTTLLGMGAEAESKALAGTHFGHLMWDDGLLHYGLVAVETARCKGGKKTKMGVHTGALTEVGHRFPPVVKRESMAATQAAWAMTLSEKCKVDQVLEVFVSEKPLATADELAAWNQSQQETLGDRVVKKTLEFAEETPVHLD
jgi:hypothetical protein